MDVLGCNPYPRNGPLFVPAPNNRGSPCFEQSEWLKRDYLYAMKPEFLLFGEEAHYFIETAHVFVRDMGELMEASVYSLYSSGLQNFLQASPSCQEPLWPSLYCE